MKGRIRGITQRAQNRTNKSVLETEAGIVLFVCLFFNFASNHLNCSLHFEYLDTVLVANTWNPDLGHLCYL